MNFPKKCQHMGEAQWDEDSAHCVGMFISGKALADIDRFGRQLQDDDFLLLFNAHHEDVNFIIPDLPGQPWTVCVDTAVPAAAATRLAPGVAFPLRGRSLVVLSRPAGEFLLQPMAPMS